MKTMTQQEYEKVMGDHGAKASSAHGFYSSVVAGAGQCATGAAEPCLEIPVLCRSLNSITSDLEEVVNTLLARLAPITATHPAGLAREGSCPAPNADTELGQTIGAAINRLIALRDSVTFSISALQL